MACNGSRLLAGRLGNHGSFPGRDERFFYTFKCSD